MVFLRFDLVTYFSTFVTYLPGHNIVVKNFGPISIIVPNMNQIHQMVKKIWALKNLNVNVETDAEANDGGSA